MERGYHEDMTHTGEDSDCCPKDGHKKQDLEKKIIQLIQKKCFDVVTPSFLSIQDFQLYIYRVVYVQVGYKQPMRDRQSFFFVDTIRLLT